MTETQAGPTLGDPTQSPDRSTPSGSTQPPSDPSTSGDHSDQHNIPYWDPRLPYYIGEPGARDGGRMTIYPEGDRGFCPSTGATPAVTRSIKSQYSGQHAFWPTWGFVPPALKKRMMQNFEAECKWHHALDYKIPSNFPKKCSDIMKNAMYNARQSGQMPGWIYADQWTQLQEYWQSPEFFKKSEQGKKAQASEKGGSLHIGGSVSAATHKMRLEKKEKRAYSVPEMHKIRHIKKDKKQGEIWVEPRAKETWEKGTKAIDDHRSTQQSECGSSTPAPLTLEDETRIWLEVNGGVKKGSAYGLGTMCASEKAYSSFLGSYALAPSSSGDPAQTARLTEEVEELKRQNEAIRKANADHQTKMEKMMEQILSKNEKRRKKKKDRKGKRSSQGKNKSKHRHSSSSESSVESSLGSTQ